MTTATAAPAYAFRDATLDDLPRLCELFERFRAESQYAQFGPAHPEVSTPFIASLVTLETGVVLVVELDARIVGAIGMLVTPHPLSGVRCAMELFWYVEPEHRGRGAWLLRRAEAWAVEHEARFISVVSPQSPDVDRLYEALHYQRGETSWYKSLDWFDRHKPSRSTHRLYHGIRVHDGVLPDPLAYRAMAVHQRFIAVHDGPVVFQRIAPCANPSLPMWIAGQYPALMPTLTFFRQGERDQAEPNFIHTDVSMGEWTGIFYLTPDPPVGDGTAFWRYTPSGSVSSRLQTQEEGLRWRESDAWERWYTVDARFNRLVLFPAPLYHSRALYENYGHGDEARLTQNTFGTGRLS